MAGTFLKKIFIQFTGQICQLLNFIWQQNFDKTVMKKLKFKLFNQFSVKKPTCTFLLVSSAHYDDLNLMHSANYAKSVCGWTTF